MLISSLKGELLYAMAVQSLQRWLCSPLWDGGSGAFLHGQCACARLEERQVCIEGELKRMSHPVLKLGFCGARNVKREERQRQDGV